MKDIAFIYQIAKMAAQDKLPKDKALKIIERKIKACEKPKQP